MEVQESDNERLEKFYEAAYTYNLCEKRKREKTALFANICEQDQHKNVEKEFILGYLGSPVVMVIRLLTEV